MVLVARAALARSGAVMAAARCTRSASLASMPTARLASTLAASSSRAARPAPRPARLASALPPRAGAGVRTFADSTGLGQPAVPRKTALYDLHVAHGGKMVEFGGFMMPVLYDGHSVGDSHKFTRSHASIFDVGHMVQRRFTGAGAAAFLEHLTPSSISGLGLHKSTLSCFLTETGGGIVDDTVITRLGEEDFYVVTNAGCRDKDDAYLARWLGDAKLTSQLPGPVVHEEMADWGLVALQGPLAKDILADLLVDAADVARLPTVYFGESFYAHVKLGADGQQQTKAPILISRGGYTGEDGFEIQFPPDETVAATEAMLAIGSPARVKLAGLGARDSLRLEAGLCLYGHDLDETTTVAEAGLNWVVGKSRTDDHSFLSADVVLSQLAGAKQSDGLGVARRRTGLVVEGAPAREGATIVEAGAATSTPSTQVGRVTSGCPSPTLGQNIAMAYVQDGLHVPGTLVDVLVRGKPRRAVITKLPFVKPKYHRKPKAKKAA